MTVYLTPHEIKTRLLGLKEAAQNHPSQAKIQRLVHEFIELKKNTKAGVKFRDLIQEVLISILECDLELWVNTTSDEDLIKKTNKKEVAEKIRKFVEGKFILANPLKSLDFRNRQLTELPESLGLLKNLTYLDVSGNQLTTFPRSLGNCTLLTELKAEDNQLTFIPFELHQCPVIFLFLKGNEHLMEIPLAFTQFKDRIKFTVDSTNEMLVSLTNPEDDELEGRLKLWGLASKLRVELNLPYSLKIKQDLNQWLAKLEKNPMFYCRQESQEYFSEAIVSILLDISQSTELEKFFSDYLNRKNNQTSLSWEDLDELFAVWKVLTLPQGISENKKIELLTYGCKTLALRKVLTRKIQMQKREFLSHSDRFEIFIYYENAFHNQGQNLVSITQPFSPKEEGRRDWITIDDVTKEMNIEASYALTSLKPLCGIQLGTKKLRTRYKPFVKDRSAFPNG